MRIGIDFDRVLFDTDSFDEYMKQETEGLHHVEADVEDEYGNYDPEKHARECGIEPGKVWDALKKLEKFVYEDVEKLEELDEHELVIVTRGNQKFQRTKIENSGVEKFFDKVYTVQQGSKEVGEIEFLVDDREEELDQVDVPGFKFDRSKHEIEDIVEKVRELET